MIQRLGWSALVLTLSAGVATLDAQDDRRTLTLGDPAVESIVTSEMWPLRGSFDLTRAREEPGANPWKRLFSISFLTMSDGRIRPEMPWTVIGGVTVRINDRTNVIAGVRFRHSYTPQMIFAESAGVDLAVGNIGALYPSVGDDSTTAATEVALGFGLLNANRLNLTGVVEGRNLIPLSKPLPGSPAEQSTSRTVVGKLRFDFK